jgi:hypothetical protein
VQTLSRGIRVLRGGRPAPSRALITSFRPCDIPAPDHRFLYSRTNTQHLVLHIEILEKSRPARKTSYRFSIHFDRRRDRRVRGESTYPPSPREGPAHTRPDPLCLVFELDIVCTAQQDNTYGRPGFVIRNRGQQRPIWRSCNSLEDKNEPRISSSCVPS